ncbi:cerato-ulmin [Ophiostoma piceae UAMH 11346]|uniref:Cerato-ulmin n=1 Tax=Ophiostoma piceae (strain UAMH 11346) TaxID=1262450 RepID=S3C6S3_OPHP1|nr:cerato-ulmin [Ophiostoma piceae UAMH 11346]
MQFSIATIVVFLTAAMAAPYSGGGDYKPCVGLLSGTPQCCDVDVLGLADLNCISPPVVPTSAQGFSAICTGAGGREAKCCAVPLLGQALVCTNPQGL